MRALFLVLLAVAVALPAWQLCLPAGTAALAVGELRLASPRGPRYPRDPGHDAILIGLTFTEVACSPARPYVEPGSLESGHG